MVLVWRQNLCLWVWALNSVCLCVREKICVAMIVSMCVRVCVCTRACTFVRVCVYVCGRCVVDQCICLCCAVKIYYQILLITMIGCVSLCVYKYLSVYYMHVGTLSCACTRV